MICAFVLFHIALVLLTCKCSWWEVSLQHCHFCYAL